MFRWKGIALFGVIIAIILIIGFFFIDGWMESGIETAAEMATGAKVEIDDFYISFTSAKTGWMRLQVANPNDTWRNLIETGDCDIDVEFLPLLSGKIIIEEIRVAGVRTNTERESDGKLESETKSTAPGFTDQVAANLSEEVSSLPAFQAARNVTKVNTDSLMKLLNLSAPGRIDSLQKALEANYTAWSEKLNTNNWESDLEDIENQVKAIDVNKIKTVPDAQKAIASITAVRGSVEQLTADIKNTESKLNTDLTAARTGMQSINGWIESDFNRALKMAKLPDISSANIGKLIFGKQVVGEVNQYLAYISTARKYSAKLSSGKPEKETPPRLKGQDIYFYNANARPDFWIKKIDLSGSTEAGLELTGLIENIVSDQRQIGKATTVAIQGRDKQTEFSLNGDLNYLDEIPQETFSMLYNGFPLNGMKIADSPVLPRSITKGSGRMSSQLALKGSQINSTTRFNGSGVGFEFAQKDNPDKFTQLMHGAFADISALSFTARVSGTQSNLKFNLDSNLDDLLMAKMRESVSGELEKARTKIRERIQDETDKYRSQLDKTIAENEARLQAEVNKYRSMLDARTQEIEAKKKEIEKQKNKLGDKVKDALKGLF